MDIPRDIQIYIDERLAALKFPAVRIADLKTGPRSKFLAVYVTDTSKPAWADVNGAYRYADGSAV
jgi:hypothetical protein